VDVIECSKKSLVQITADRFRKLESKKFQAGEEVYIWDVF